MTRRPAATRHADFGPATTSGDETGPELLDVLIAFHHPTRRWMFEILGAEGPANVGTLASRTSLAVGSVSHHLKALHRYGFVEPAPELARDTRESWWRSTGRSLSWRAEDFTEGTVGRQVAESAELANFGHQVRAVREWMATEASLPENWRVVAGSSDTFVPATPAQTAALRDRLLAVIVDWSRECRVDAERHPEAVRRSVRALARVFPSGPVRP